MPAKMCKTILIISTNLRNNSNSDGLCEAFRRGAQVSGNSVEKVSQRGKTFRFCPGSLACLKTQQRAINDVSRPMVEKMKWSDVLVLATPVYYYDMHGQMKTLLDRANPLFPSNDKFRDVYLPASCADEESTAVDGTVTGVTGWITCFEKASLKGALCPTGTTDLGNVQNSSTLLQAYELGESI